MSHDYLSKKQINSWLKCSQIEKLRVDKFGNLIVPIRNIYNELMGFQRISANGIKRFAKGSQKYGNFYLLISEGLTIADCDYLFIGEGVANAITAYLMLQSCLGDDVYACMVAFDVGNIKPVFENVAKHYLSKHRHIHTTLIADNDCANNINTGVETCIKIRDQYKNQYSIDIILPYINESTGEMGVCNV